MRLVAIPRQGQGARLGGHQVQSRVIPACGEGQWFGDHERERDWVSVHRRCGGDSEHGNTRTAEHES
jgi:hypothetical protein